MEDLVQKVKTWWSNPNNTETKGIVAAVAIGAAVLLFVVCC